MPPRGAWRGAVEAGDTQGKRAGAAAARTRRGAAAGVTPNRPDPPPQIERELNALESILRADLLSLAADDSTMKKVRDVHHGVWVPGGRPPPEAPEEADEEEPEPSSLTVVFRVVRAARVCLTRVCCFACVRARRARVFLCVCTPGGT